jgi:hypothetical protein
MNDGLEKKSRVITIVLALDIGYLTGSVGGECDEFRYYSFSDFHLLINPVLYSQAWFMSSLPSTILPKCTLSGFLEVFWGLSDELGGGVSKN